MKKILIYVITLCLLASLLIFISTTDLHEVFDAIRGVGFKFILLLMITFIAYVFGTISWQFALGTDFKNVSIFKLFLIRHIGETVSLFNPASIIGGDAVKGIMLADYHISRKSVVFSVFLSRVILVITQVLLLIIAIAALMAQNPAIGTAGVSGSRSSGILPLLLVRWRVLKFKLKGLWTELPEVLKENKNMLAISCVFALLHWIFGSLEFYFILKFLGVKATVSQALLVDMGVVLFKAAGAFIPGQLGVEEYGNKVMLLAIGVGGADVWVTASILRRARQLVWVGFGILIYFLMFHKRKAVLQI